MLIRLLAPILCAAAVTACSENEHASAAIPAASALNASAATTSAPDDNTTGAEVYNKACFVCHGSGAGGAPMLGAREEWEPRIARGKDTLYLHAIEGFVGEKGVMPAKGANPSLTDDEVRAAVDYMQSQVR